MSLARIYTTQKSRKVWTCSKCRREIPVGSKVLSFAVGFRGFEQKRCGDNPTCYPTRGERESSLLAEIYDAADGIDLGSAESLDDLTNAVQEVIDACESVASQYQDNEMFEINYELQERAEMVEAAGEQLSSWADDLEDEPDENEERFNEEECGSCQGSGTTENDEANCDDCDGRGYLAAEESFEDAHDAWLEEAAQAAQQAIDEMELP